METPYPWYHIVNGEEPFLQGDFVSDCPVVIPPSAIPESKEIYADIIKYDVIIMSQSCDLIQRKLDLVLVCPIWPLSELEKRFDFLKSNHGKERLRRGDVPGYHLLNKCKLNGFNTDYFIVDFRSVYSVPFNFLENFVKTKEKRIRLLPPYREHLSQAFARFFMRVGLPVDIPPFK
jgi:hypothetical protein